MGSVRKWADFCSDDEDQGNDIDHDDRCEARCGSSFG